MRILLTAAILACFAAPAGASDEIYKCKAPDGTTVFASRPCGADAEPVAVKPPPSFTPSPEYNVGNSTDPEDQAARAEADKIAASCRSDVWRLDVAVRRAREWDYEREVSGFALRHSQNRAHYERVKADRIVAAIQRRDETARMCDERWLSAYQAAKFR